MDINTVDNCSDNEFFAISKGTEYYNLFIDSLKNNFDSLYQDKCLQAVNYESFTVTHDVNEFHYTLYYYDQAGNLVKTVSPAGVHPNRDATWLSNVAGARQAKTSLVPSHLLSTNYRFNTLNQVVAQQTPDAGHSQFWYDRLGRLAISQNAKQKALSGAETGRFYSYTNYDRLGRITEVGQIMNADTAAVTDSISRRPALLNNWLALSSQNKEQITTTVYDLPYSGLPPGNPYIGQRNLRNRVAYTTFSPGANPAQYTSGSFYSYDAHGNVDTLLQDYGTSAIAGLQNIMNANNNRFKKMVYRYDLISGKVNHVAYQPGEADQLYHRYSYDAENRLTNVETSHDSLYWDNEAFYSYYKHGPLARTLIGQQQVQGLDYAYTLQGWLKGINSTAVGTTFDIGGDGFSGSSVARDAFGFALHYYGSQDYSPVDATVKPFAEAAAAGLGYKALYNGNISGMSVNLPAVGTPLLYTYTYDQLNRLTKMFTYSGLTPATNSWTPVATQDFRETAAYDPNGNIGTYVRNGNTAASMPLAMDNLAYRYYYTANNGTRKTYDPLATLPADVRELSNRLAYVTDAVSSSNYAADVDNQPVNNYDYDEIGNLVKDSAEGIAGIDWTVYGKIANIKKTNGLSIAYTYDAAGNRISKSVYTPGTDTTVTTWYVRDASGNVMAVYGGSGTGSDASDYTLRLQEQHLYGSSRLGVWNRDFNMKAHWSSPDTSVFLRGMKRYELANHLGNVLAVVSDRRTGVDSTNDGNVDYYTAKVINAQDYYAFGMLTPGRQYTAGSGYRYGFNGKEKDGEAKGEGAQYDYGFRVYDPRIGKFLSIDPLTQKYPWYTPYQFAGNKPVWAIDIDGQEELILQEVEKRKATMSINKTVVIDNKLPRDVTTTQSTRLANLFTGTFTFYFDKLPVNGSRVSEIPKEDFDAGKGVQVDVQFNVRSQGLDHGDFIAYKGMNGLDAKYSFVSEVPGYVPPFSGDNAVFKSTTYAPEEVWANPDFFRNIGLSSGMPSIEELIAHEIGKHNMMGEFETRDPATGQGIYPPPTTTTLGSNTPGKIRPSQSDVLTIINNSAQNFRIGNDLINALKNPPKVEVKLPRLNVPNVSKPELQTPTNKKGA